MRKVITSVLVASLLLFITYTSVASNSTDYFRSKASGNWTSIGSWQSSTGPTGPWANATLVPTQSANTITILSTHKISINTARTFDQLVIKLGGELELLTGGSITLNNGTGFDMTIENGGVFAILSSQNYASTFFPGTSAMSIDGDVEIGNNTTNAGTGYEALASNINNSWLSQSTYNHNSNSAVVTAANVVFFPNSTTGFPTLAIRRLAGTFGNSSSIVVNGQFLMYSNVTIDGAGTKSFPYGFYGNITLTTAATSGTINVGNASIISNIGGDLRFILHKNVNIIYSMRLLDASGFGEIKTIDNSSTAKFVISSGRTLLNEAGTFDLGTNAVITNNGTFSNAGIVRTANANGLIGSTTTSVSGGTWLNETYSTVEYYGSTQAVTAITYGNLMISGTGIKTAGTFNLATTGRLTITGSATLNATGNIGPTTLNTTALIMDATSRFILHTAGTQPNMQGTYTLTGNSVIEFANNNVSAQSIRNGSTYVYHNIDISGNNVGNASANIFLNGASVFRVTATGIFSNNSNSIQAQTATTGQSVTMLAGGLFKVFNQGGFNGTTNTAIHQTITSFSLATASTIEYARNGDQTITNANSLQYGNLTLSVSGIKTAPSGILYTRGNLNKSGTASFAHNSGTVVMNGTAAQNYTSNAPFMKFYNFTNNNTVDLSINNEMSIERELAFGSSSKLNLQTAANIILLSSNTATANVGIIPSNATVTYTGNGRFTIHRYIATGPIPNHGKTWQFLAVPANGGQTINEAWQDTATAANQSRYAGFGTQITSNITPLPSRFDVYTVAGPSMKTFVSAGNTWSGVANTTGTPLYNSKGYMVFVRGDRTVTTYNAPATSTILRTSGRIFWPVSNLPPTTTVTANMFESIGNPFASAINFSNDAGVVKSANIQKVFYVWDPKLGSSLGYGAYQTFIKGAGADNNYYVTPGGGSYGASGSINNVIQSGQAFFVRAFGGSGTVSFNETAKTSGSSTTFRTSPTESNYARLFIQLKQTGIDGTVLLDGVMEEFGRELSNAIDPLDAYKFTMSTESIAINCAGTDLAVERRKLPELNDTLFFKLTNLKQQQYHLYFSGDRISHWERQAFLIDKFLHTTTELNLSQGSVISFAVTSDPASSASNRYSIIFKLKQEYYSAAEYAFMRVEVRK